MATPPTLRKLGRAERARTRDNVAHQIDAIRSKVDEIIQALYNLNVNVTGSATGTALAVGHAAWTGSYSTTSADGILDTYLRSDTTLKYPPALGTPAKVVALSNDGTEGALLTADNTFSVNGFSLKAPNATNAFRVGKYGNIALGGTATLTDTVLVNVIKNDYNDATIGITGINFSVANTGTTLVIGAKGTAANTGANAGGVITPVITGGAFTAQGGALSNNNFQGTLKGLVSTVNISAQTVGTAAVAMYGLHVTANTITRNAVTDVAGTRISTTTLSFSGTITNHYGHLVDALTTGTNRYGMNIAAMTTGTPTVATGVEVATHSVGTTRRSFRGGNTFECTANDFYVSTAAKGLLVKDGQGTPHYWRFTTAADGTPAIVDTGSTAPTV